MAADVAASIAPEEAIFRLCDQVMDGGRCAHCHRPCGVARDLEPLPAGEVICWYVYDPELDTYRRGCEGDT